MLAEMDGELLHRWRCYFHAEPFGPGVQAVQLARLAMHQAAQGTGKEQRLVDFIPGYDDFDDDGDDDPGDMGDD